MSVTLTSPQKIRIIRRPEIEYRTGLSWPTIHRHSKLGLLPPLIKLSDTGTRQAPVGMVESELDECLAKRARRT